MTTNAPITKLWYMTLKDSSVSPTDPTFTQIWNDVFAWVKQSGSSGPIQLWQNVSLPSSLVLINGWPSSSTRDAAFDSPQEKEFGEKLSKYVESRGYKQLSLAIDTVPLNAPLLSVETFSVAAADSAIFEGKALEAQQHVSDKTKASAVVGGWDVYQETLLQKVKDKTSDVVGEEAKEQGIPRQREWVSITGWADEEQHIESAKEITSQGQFSADGGSGVNMEGAREKVEATKNVFQTVHLKKILG